MGTTTVYLIPELATVSPLDYAARVKAVLLDMGIIEEPTRSLFLEFFPPGPQSLLPFENDIGWDCGFEDCILYGADRKAVVPQDPAVEPRCPACSRDVTEDYYELLNSSSECDPVPPDDELRLTCPDCGAASRLDQLVDPCGIYLVNAYVNFDDIPSSVRPDWLEDFASRMGMPHRSVEYWYT